MGKKIVKNYIYNGLGFPIELHNVEMILLEGEYHPKIDVRKIANTAIKSLVGQEDRLTGNQIKFIRTHLSLSLREFAKVVNESHMAVKKWENFKDKPTNMDKNIEIMLRLHIYNDVVVKVNNDNNKKIKFYNQFLALTEMFAHSHSQKILTINSHSHAR